MTLRAFATPVIPDLRAWTLAGCPDCGSSDFLMLLVRERRRITAAIDRTSQLGPVPEHHRITTIE